LDFLPEILKTSEFKMSPRYHTPETHDVDCMEMGPSDLEE